MSVLGRGPGGYDWGDGPAFAALRLPNRVKVAAGGPAGTGFVREREVPSRRGFGSLAILPRPTAARLRLVILLGLLTPLFATVRWLVAAEATPRTEVQLVPEIVEVPVEVEVTVERTVERIVYVPAPDETATPEPSAGAAASPAATPAGLPPRPTSTAATRLTPASR